MDFIKYMLAFIICTVMNNNMTISYISNSQNITDKFDIFCAFTVINASLWPWKHTKLVHSNI